MGGMLQAGSRKHHRDLLEVSGAHSVGLVGFVTDLDRSPAIAEYVQCSKSPSFSASGT